MRQPAAISLSLASLLLAALLLAFMVAGCGGGRPQGDGVVTVFAAASLADVLEEQAVAYGAAHPGAPPVRFHFAGSNLLAQQILAGAPAHLYISADRRQVAALAEAGRVEPGNVVPLLANRLVVVVPASSPRRLQSPRDLTTFERLALADPEAVPAGVYARRWLEDLGLWGELRHRVVPALDVRAALAAVAAGHLPAGIVYATDANADDGVYVAYEVPEGVGPPVRYHAAPVTGGAAEAGGGPGKRGDNPPAADFLAFLASPEGGEIFARHGFRPLTASAAPPPGAPRSPAARR